MADYLPNPGTPKQIKEFLSLDEQARHRRLGHNAKYSSPHEVLEVLQGWEVQTKKGRWAQKHKKTLTDDMTWLADCWDLRSAQERELLSALELADTEVERVQHIDPRGYTTFGPSEPSAWRENPSMGGSRMTDKAVWEILELPPVERHEYYAAMAAKDPPDSARRVLDRVLSWADRAVEGEWDVLYPDKKYGDTIGKDLKWLQDCYAYEVVHRGAEAVAEQEAAEAEAEAEPYYEPVPEVGDEFVAAATESAVETLHRTARKEAKRRVQEDPPDPVSLEQPAEFGGGARAGMPEEEPLGYMLSEEEHREREAAGFAPLPRRRNPPEKKGKPVKYATALTMAQAVIADLRQAKVTRRKSDIVVAGSLRRRAKMVNDIDILLVDTTPASWNKLEQVEGLTLTMFGPKKAQGVYKKGRRKIRVDFRAVSSDSLGAALEYFTGPKQHNLGMRAKAKRQGMKLNEYGLFHAETGELIAADTEKAIYAALGHKWKPPWERSGTRKNPPTLPGWTYRENPEYLPKIHGPFAVMDATMQVVADGFQTLQSAWAWVDSSPPADLKYYAYRVVAKDSDGYPYPVTREGILDPDVFLPSERDAMSGRALPFGQQPWQQTPQGQQIASELAEMGARPIPEPWRSELDRLQHLEGDVFAEELIRQLGSAQAAMAWAKKGYVKMLFLKHPAGEAAKDKLLDALRRIEEEYPRGNPKRGGKRRPKPSKGRPGAKPEITDLTALRREYRQLVTRKGRRSGPPMRENADPLDEMAGMLDELLNIQISTLEQLEKYDAQGMSPNHARYRQAERILDKTRRLALRMLAHLDQGKAELDAEILRRREDPDAD
jgi:hypothetical protein